MPPIKKPVAKKPVPVAKKPAKAAAGVPTWYSEAGKPDPKGLYNRDGFMSRTSVPKDDFKKTDEKKPLKGHPFYTK